MMLKVKYKFLSIIVILLIVKKANSEYDKLNFRLVKGPSPENYDKIFIKDWSKLLHHRNFKLQDKTVFYIFGWTEKYSSRSTQLVVRSHLSRNNHNIVVLDWGDYSDGEYFEEVAPSVEKIGEIFGKVFIKMLESDLKSEKVHIVGHSLGGQMAGFIGKTINENSTMKVQRISALDPAGPGFYPNEVLRTPKFFPSHLTEDDAHFVDVIHTDAFFTGAPYSTGTVDFYPNGGANQTGCPPMNLRILSDPNNVCSHHRSWMYWSESVSTHTHHTFHSIKCTDWEEFKEHKCDRHSGIGFMGYDADQKLRGDYFLQTNPSYHYSRNEFGTVYDEGIELA